MLRKTSVDVYSKPTNSFTYVLPSTCYLFKYIGKVLKGIALRLSGICNTNEKYNQCSSEYQNYLIGREYNPTLVKKQFEEVGNMTRTHVRASKWKPNQVRKISLIKKHLPLLDSDDKVKTLFPTETFNIVYRENKILKELLLLSLFPNPGREK